MSAGRCAGLDGDLFGSLYAPATFFVLLLSFANMDVIKFQDMAGSMKDAFGYRQENFGNFHPELLARKSKVLSALDEVKTGGPLKTQRKMERKVRDLIKRQKADDKVESESTENGFIIRVKDSVMFTGGNRGSLRRASRSWMSWLSSLRSSRAIWLFRDTPTTAR